MVTFLMESRYYKRKNSLYSLNEVKIHFYSLDRSENSVYNKSEVV